MDQILNSVAVLALVIGLAVIVSAPVYAQTTESIRICSSFERDQAHAVNSSGEILMIASDSMSPLLTTGDIVAVGKNVNFSDVGTGDIIAFKEPVPDTDEAYDIISRVNEILIDPEDNLVIVTKGDANSGSIPGIDFPIYENNFIGIVSELFSGRESIQTLKY